MFEKADNPDKEEEFIEVDVDSEPEEQVSQEEIKLIPEEVEKNHLSVEILNLVNNNQVDELTEIIWTLKQELREAKIKQDEFLYTAQRVQADFENFKKRIQKDQEFSNSRVKSSILLKLTTLYEDLERTLTVLNENDDLKTSKEAIKMIFNNTKSTFETLGIKPINPIDEIFDPKYHEALYTVEDAKKANNQVIDVVSKGFMLEGILLKPARVIIAKPPQKKKEEEDSS
jgi:molecular chaperone GrpE